MIYFIQDSVNGAIKIGYTSQDPEIRLSTLQTGNPNTLTIIGLMHGSSILEKYLHYKFREHHIRGEWFMPHERIFARIEDRDGFPFKGTKEEDKALQLLMRKVGRVDEVMYKFLKKGSERPSFYYEVLDYRKRAFEKWKPKAIQLFPEEYWNELMQTFDWFEDVVKNRTTEKVVEIPNDLRQFA